MKYLFLISALLIYTNTLFAQLPSSTQVLEKSIQYHDPKGEWFEQNFSMAFEQTRPNGAITKIDTDFWNGKSQFRYISKTDTLSKVYFIKNKEDECTLILNGSETISEADAKNIE